MIKLRNLFFILTIVCFWYQISGVYQKLVPVFWYQFLVPVSGQYVMGIISVNCLLDLHIAWDRL